MIVVAHGDVDAYCEAHGMTIAERYAGKLEDYSGRGLILVTDNCESLNDYYYLKYKLRRRRVELVSTHWHDQGVSDFIQYLGDRESDDRKKTYTGRLPFGFHRVGGKTVEDPAVIEIARRIVAMRDAGATYREIVEDEDVRYPDGRRMSISTIQVILRNRSKYE